MAGPEDARERLRKNLGKDEADALLKELDELAVKSAKKIELVISDAITELADASVNSICARMTEPKTKRH